ncbi:HEPN domain-containing protein [Ectopseudomonas oleovorans]|nr:HEPN domain-containing protein [Pseudomonas oleovorans]
MLDELKAEIIKLGDKFLLPWLPAKPEHQPEQFEHDVKAYCVLTHAIFEEFVEELSLMAMEEAIEAWKKKNPTKGTISLLCSYGACLSIPEKDEEDQEDVFTQIRKELDETKSKHSNVLSNNHGFSLKYLRKILTPVGVDIPTDIVLLESLKNLAEARGSFAHTQAQKAQYGKWKQAKKPMTPEQARVAVNDCIDLCQKLVDRAVVLMGAVAPAPAAVAGGQAPVRPRLPK